MRYLRFGAAAAEPAPLPLPTDSKAVRGEGYRPDIDGLRAIAVLPVVLFHAGLAAFGGGYVGVDIFFVISGYLITLVIFEEVKSGTFSVLRFYERRARRIFPALIATAVLIFVAGWFIFLPDEQRNLGAEMAAVSGFASNFLFWLQTDYFAGAGELRPFLHTWSLAVEEQFYIAFPLMLLLLSRTAGQRFIAWTAAIAAISFIVGIAWLRLDSTGAYYLPAGRAWELMIGALLAMGAVPRIRNRKVNELLAVVGLLLIAGSVLLLTEDSAFPGVNALWPCLGAALLIHTGGSSPTVVGRWLGTKPFVAVGLISYSLYLVHWPILVFSSYYLMRPLHPTEVVAALVLMFLLAYLSWRFVERPFRNRKRISRRTVWISTGLGLFAIGALGVATFMTGGWPSRFPPHVRAMVAASKENHADPRCFIEGGFRQWGGDHCLLVRGSGPRVLLWGDSHANHYVPAILNRRDRLRSTILQYTSAACLPLLDTTLPRRPYCEANNAYVLDIIRRYDIERVVLAANWAYGLERNGAGLDDVRRTVDRLRGLGLDVRIIGDSPDFSFSNPGFLAYRLAQRADPDAPFFVGTRNDWDINRSLEAMVGPQRFVDPLAMLCRPNRECLVYTQGESLMTDNAHFSRFGAELVMSRSSLGLE
jgi:peptidoglycan/LPS O-acetylase OafA/YrhL